MNSGVIIKIEYRIFPEVNFANLDIIPHSGSFKEEPSKTNAGLIFTFDSSFKIAKIEQSTDDIINLITDRKAQFRITDGNGTKHLVGDDLFPARLFATRSADGQPGSFNGYLCSISRKSTSMSVIEA